jgi:hypothetical protein
MEIHLSWKKRLAIPVILFNLLLFCPVFLYTQTSDNEVVSSSKQGKDPKSSGTTNNKGKQEAKFFSDHSPKKATYLALVPGLGQIYNKKYWKIPIVYAGFAVTGYFAITNQQYYQDYKEAYICSTNAAADTSYTCDNPLAQKYSTENLLSLKDYYRRNMELSYIIMGAWYILQILDATVDAHLYYWDVAEGVTLRTEPVIRPNVISGRKDGFYGVKIAVNF